MLALMNSSSCIVPDIAVLLVSIAIYKRVTDSLKEKTSDVLNASIPPAKKEKLDSELPSETFVDNKENKPMGAPSHCLNFTRAANFTVNFNY